MRLASNLEKIEQNCLSCKSMIIMQDLAKWKLRKMNGYLARFLQVFAGRAMLSLIVGELSFVQANKLPDKIECVLGRKK